MAWTTPRTWVTAEIVTAAMMNSDVRDNSRFLKGLDGLTTLESSLAITGALSGATTITASSFVTGSRFYVGTDNANVRLNIDANTLEAISVVQGLNAAIADAHGAQIYPTANFTGTTTNYRGFWARAGVNTAGTVTNSYGAYIEALAFGTNKWAAYFSGKVETTGQLIIGGALSGVTTLSLTGAISGATATNTINSVIINAGALSAVTTITASGLIKSTASTGIECEAVSAIVQADTTSATGDAYFIWQEIGVDRYFCQYSATNNRWSLHKFVNDAVDVIRVNDTLGDLSVDGNTTFDDNAFDFVCATCGWHGADEVMQCPKCGDVVKWHDDAALMQSATSKPWQQNREAIKRLEQLGLVKTYGTLYTDKPELYTSLSRMPWFLMAGQAQQWRRGNWQEERINQLEHRIAGLEGKVA